MHEVIFSYARFFAPEEQDVYSSRRPLLSLAPLGAKCPWPQGAEPTFRS